MKRFFVLILSLVFALVVPIYAQEKESCDQMNDTAAETLLEDSDRISNEETAKYMRHIVNAFLALIPGLIACSVYVNVKTKKRSAQSQKESGGPEFKGSIKSLSIKETKVVRIKS